MSNSRREDGDFLVYHLREKRVVLRLTMSAMEKLVLAGIDQWPPPRDAVNRKSTKEVIA